MVDLIHPKLVKRIPGDPLVDRQPVRLTAGLRDPDPDKRITEIRRTDNPFRLWYMAQCDPDPEVSLAAAERIERPGPVKILAQKSPHAAVRINAIGKTNASTVLEDIAANDIDPEVQEAASARRKEIGPVFERRMNSNFAGIAPTASGTSAPLTTERAEEIFGDAESKRPGPARPGDIQQS